MSLTWVGTALSPSNLSEQKSKEALPPPPNGKRRKRGVTTDDGMVVTMDIRSFLEDVKYYTSFFDGDARAYMSLTLPNEDHTEHVEVFQFVPHRLARIAEGTKLRAFMPSRDHPTQSIQEIFNLAMKFPSEPIQLGKVRSHGVLYPMIERVLG